MELLELWVIEAKSLATKHKSGKSDAYCRLRTNFNTQQYKTSSAVKAMTPQWGQSFRFYPADDPPTGNITIKLYERKSLFKDPNVGQVVLDISNYVGGAEHDVWIVLQDEPKKKHTNLRGEIHLKLRYSVSELHDTKDPKDVRSRIKSSPTPHTRAAELAAQMASSPSSPLTSSIPLSPQAGPLTHASSFLRLEDKYDLGDELGKGAFSSVYRAKNKFTDEDVAIKVVKKRDVKPRDLELLEREIKILKKLRHPNIVRLYDLFDGVEKMYIVLELVPGGELFDQLVQNGSYSESDARSIIRQVLEGVDYMHKNGVVHRDLKPENLLCKDPTHIKIADFGMSKDISSMGILKTAVGTPSYIAPEIIQGSNNSSYDSGCDIWSVGVLTYVILCGYTPFWGSTQDQLFTRITKAMFDFPAPEWDDISAPAKDFVSSLLTANPADRPSAEEALCHMWIKNKETSQAKLTLASKNLAIMTSQKLQDNAQGRV